MEDAPRNNNNDEVILPHPDVESSTDETYSRIWRRLRLRKPDYFISGQESEDDDEDEDDETSSELDENSVNVKRYQKRFLRLRKKIRPFLPVLESVQSDESSKEHSLDKDTKNIIEVNIETSITDAEVAHDGKTIEPKKEQSIHEDSKIEDMTVSKDPESVLDILRRSPMNNEFIQTINSVNVTPDSMTESNSKPQHTQDARISPKTSSFSDKYFEKKELKKHVKKMHEKELKVQNSKQEELRKDLESKILESEKQHYILKESIERATPTQTKQIEYGKESKKHNVKTDLEPKQSHEKMIKASDADQHEQAMREALILESRKEIDRISSFDKTLNKVNELKKSSITNEFAFERRHEVKDEPGNSVNTKFIPLSAKERHDMQSSIGKSQSELNNKGKTALARAVHDIQKSNATSHAVSAGALGAIVGALIFLAIHTLN